MFVGSKARKVQPQVADSQLGTRLGAMAPASEALLSAFINLGDELNEASEAARLAMARALIVKGDRPALEQALAQIKTLLHDQ